MPTKLAISTIEEFSRRYLAFQQFPKGWELRAFRKLDDRQVRLDMRVKRRLITPKNVEVVDDDKRVASVLDEAYSVLSIDLKARGIYFRLIDKDRNFIENNAGVKAIRSLAAKEKEPPEPDAYLVFLENAELGDLSFSEAAVVWRELKEVFGDNLEPAMKKYLAKLNRRKK